MCQVIGGAGKLGASNSHNFLAQIGQMVNKAEKSPAEQCSNAGFWNILVAGVDICQGGFERSTEGKSVCQRVRLHSLPSYHWS